MNVFVKLGRLSAGYGFRFHRAHALCAVLLAYSSFFLNSFAVNAAGASPLLGFAQTAGAPQMASKPPADGRTVLAKVGSESITYKTLEEAYRKNVNNKNVTLSSLPADSVKDFLNLYINYRLKVMDAKARGFHKKPEIENEIRQNRAILAAPYLFERRLTNPRVELSLERRKRQFQVWLIFTKINDDTAAAYKRSVSMLQALNKGADFRAMAKDSSDDEFFRSTSGVLPMITSDRVVREIEDVVFQMRVGEIYPKPVRSNLGVPGYYIVKLTAMEPRLAVRGRYILLKPILRQSSIPMPMLAEDSTALQKRADSVLGLIRGGLDFAEAAKRFSEDGYGQYGGIFPAYYTQTTGYVNGLRARFPEKVEEWLFAKERANGDMSGVLATPAGMFIVRRDSSQIGGDDREELKRFYKRVHFEADKQAFLDSVKQARKYVLNAKALNGFLSAVDTTRPSFDSAQQAKLPAKLRKEALCKMNGFTLSVASFGDSLLRRADLRGFSLTRQGMTQAIDKIMETAVVNILTATMERDYPDFAALMREFEDGILIFRIEEQEIWSKMKFDTARARQYYEPRKERYKTQELYDFSEIWVESDSLANALAKRLQAAGKNNAALFDSLAANFTERSGYKERKGKWDAMPATEFTIPAELKNRKAVPGDVVGPFKFQGAWSVVRYNEFFPVRQKTFEEAIPDFAAQFQDNVQKELTQQWLDRLRKEYAVTVEQTNFSSIWK